MSSHHRASTYSRRDLGLLAVAGLATAPLGGSGTAAAAERINIMSIDPVRLGVGTSSFHDLPHRPGVDPADSVIQAMTECDVRECELCSSVIEPAPFTTPSAPHHTGMPSMKTQMMRRELRKWRVRTPLAHFESIGARFRAAGIRVDAYRYSPDASFSDEEIDRGFSIAKALGAEILTTRSSPELAARMAPFADRHRMVVAFAGKGATTGSSFFRVQADIGQLTADNVDPVSYIRQHHAEITSVCLTDRRRNGEAVAWGQGDTPIREVLQMLERERWPIRAYVEYQYRGEGSTIDEVRKCLAYAKQALA